MASSSSEHVVMQLSPEELLVEEFVSDIKTGRYRGDPRDPLLEEKIQEKLKNASLLKALSRRVRRDHWMRFTWRFRMVDEVTAAEEALTAQEIADQWIKVTKDMKTGYSGSLDMRLRMEVLQIIKENLTQEEFKDFIEVFVFPICALKYAPLDTTKVKELIGSVVSTPPGGVAVPVTSDEKTIQNERVARLNVLLDMDPSKLNKILKIAEDMKVTEDKLEKEINYVYIDMCINGVRIGRMMEAKRPMNSRGTYVFVNATAIADATQDYLGGLRPWLLHTDTFTKEECESWLEKAKKMDKALGIQRHDDESSEEEEEEEEVQMEQAPDEQDEEEESEELVGSLTLNPEALKIAMEMDPAINLLKIQSTEEEPDEQDKREPVP